MRSSSEILTIAQWLASWAAVAALVGLYGCASTTPLAYEDLPSSSQLKPVKKGNDLFLYTDPNADIRNYASLIIDPVTVYAGKDSQFGSVTDEGRRAIAEYMRQQFTAVLGKKYQIVTAANSGTLRLHLTLTGVETSTPVLSAVSHLLPAGLLVNAGFQVAGHKGTFLGSVSQAVDLYDAETGELLYASISKETAHALDLTASFGRLDAARAGVRLGAQHLCDRLTKDHLAAMAYMTPNASGPDAGAAGSVISAPLPGSDLALAVWRFAE
jgi:hypothetical protein